MNANDCLETMPLWKLARLIRQDWRKVSYAAEPYLNAMTQLDDVTSMYGFDTGVSIVSYFLCNAAGWRGDFAKCVKKELKARCTRKSLV